MRGAQRDKYAENRGSSPRSTGPSSIFRSMLVPRWASLSGRLAPILRRTHYAKGIVLCYCNASKYFAKQTLTTLCLYRRVVPASAVNRKKNQPKSCLIPSNSIYPPPLSSKVFLVLPSSPHEMSHDASRRSQPGKTLTADIRVARPACPSNCRPKNDVTFATHRDDDNEIKSVYIFAGDGLSFDGFHGWPRCPTTYRLVFFIQPLILCVFHAFWGGIITHPLKGLLVVTPRRFRRWHTCITRRTDAPPTD